MPELKPLYRHDCHLCQFLGTALLDRKYHDGVAGTWPYDLYVCQEGHMTTYLARSGDDGPEYQSMPEWGGVGVMETLSRKDSSNPLVACWRLFQIELNRSWGGGDVDEGRDWR
jgi:hypothetical protein